MRLVITEPTPGRFEAVLDDAVGAATCGVGASPQEAIGDWAMMYFADGGDWAKKHEDPCLGLPLRAVCDPPALLDRFKVDRRKQVRLQPADRRGE